MIALALKIKTIILIGEDNDMRLRKRVKVLEGMVADLVRQNETLQGRIEDLEDSVDSLLKPVLEEFEKINAAEREKQKNDENEAYSTVMDEWLNGGKK